MTTATSATAWYSSVRKWEDTKALDEFGAGTLDGDPAHGSAFDACGPASVENVRAAFEQRDPTYANIGALRKAMIGAGQWTTGAQVSNPRTGGCVIDNVKWAVEHIGYEVADWGAYRDTVLSHDDLVNIVIRPHSGSGFLFILTNGQALTYNEQGVHGHFVAITSYDPAADMCYVLNSDVAGQHGLGQGQWMKLEAFRLAEPRGYVVMRKHVTPPPPPPPAPDIAGAIVDLTQIQQLVAKAVADALAKLKAGG